jgi:hypothetical protein
MTNILSRRETAAMPSISRASSADDIIRSAGTTDDLLCRGERLRAATVSPRPPPASKHAAAASGPVAGGGVAAGVDASRAPTSRSAPAVVSASTPPGSECSSGTESEDENIRPGGAQDAALAAFAAAHVAAAMPGGGGDAAQDGYVAVPALPIGEAVSQLLTRTRTGVHKAVLACAIMDRLIAARGRRECSGRNAVRVFTVSLILAWKMLDDAPPLNSEWARVFGWYSTEEINGMEWEFLKVVNYDVGAEEEYAKLHASWIAGGGHRGCRAW